MGVLALFHEESLAPINIAFKEVAMYDRAGERIMAAIARAIAYLPIAPFTILFTWIYWVATRRISPLVDRSGRDSLNFQLSVICYALGFFVLVFVVTHVSRIPVPGFLASHGGGFFSLFGFLDGVILFSLIVALGVFYTVTVAVAIIVTLMGRHFHSPLTIRFFH